MRLTRARSKALLRNVRYSVPMFAAFEPSERQRRSTDVDCFWDGIITLQIGERTRRYAIEYWLDGSTAAHLVDGEQ